jgi:hypothetical protein
LENSSAVFAIRNRNYDLQKYGHSTYANASKNVGARIDNVDKNEMLYNWSEVNNLSE